MRMMHQVLIDESSAAHIDGTPITHTIMMLICVLIHDTKVNTVLLTITLKSRSSSLSEAGLMGPTLNNLVANLEWKISTLRQYRVVISVQIEISINIIIIIPCGV